MVKYQYAWRHRHTASMNGKTIEFRSYHFENSFYLWSDAVQACKDAGIYLKDRDADKMLIDGRPATWN